MEDTNTNQPSPEDNISSENKELMQKPGMSIADIEKAAKDNIPSSVAIAPGTANSPRRKIVDSEGAIHEFEDEDTRHEFMQKLITSKQYFVGIKQKAYHKGITLKAAGAGKRKKYKKEDIKEDGKEPAKETDAKETTTKQLEEAAAKKARNIKLSVLIVAIWVAMFLGIDLGLINIGVDLPVKIFKKDAPIISSEKVEFELIE